jgi:hypothetical protein
VRESISGEKKKKNIEFKVIIAAVSQLVVLKASPNVCLFLLVICGSFAREKKYSQAITLYHLLALSLTPV